VLVVRTKRKETKRSDRHQEVEVAVVIANESKKAQHGIDDDDDDDDDREWLPRGRK